MSQYDIHRKPGWTSLANAIVEKAADDYRGALRYLKQHPYARTVGEEYRRQAAFRHVTECEQFFQSRWFGTLTTADGEYIMRRIQDEVRGEVV